MSFLTSTCFYWVAWMSDKFRVSSVLLFSALWDHMGSSAGLPVAGGQVTGSGGAHLRRFAWKQTNEIDWTEGLRGPEHVCRSLQTHWTQIFHLIDFFSSFSFYYIPTECKSLKVTEKLVKTGQRSSQNLSKSNKHTDLCATSKTHWLQHKKSWMLIGVRWLWANHIAQWIWADFAPDLCWNLLQDPFSLHSFCLNVQTQIFKAIFCSTGL